MTRCRIAYPPPFLTPIPAIDKPQSPESRPVRIACMGGGRVLGIMARNAVSCPIAASPKSSYLYDALGRDFFMCENVRIGCDA